jgi:hypothetical protein
MKGGGGTHLRLVHALEHPRDHPLRQVGVHDALGDVVGLERRHRHPEPAHFLAGGEDLEHGRGLDLRLELRERALALHHFPLGLCA